MEESEFIINDDVIYVGKFRPLNDAELSASKDWSDSKGSNNYDEMPEMIYNTDLETDGKVFRDKNNYEVYTKEQIYG
jgi:hypothetical protein